MRKILLYMVMSVALIMNWGCKNQRPLPTQEELLRADSLERLAHLEKPRAYGSAEEEIMMSLPYRTLPVTYEEGFERALTGFGDVPPTMVPSLLGVEGLTKTKAVRLPDRDSVHVVIVGGENADGAPVVQMVTLAPKTWEPIDALVLYEETEVEEDEFTDEEDLGLICVEFSVTSRYEIYMQEVFQSFVDEERSLEGVSVFSIGSDGRFFQLEHNKLNHGAEDE